MVLYGSDEEVYVRYKNRYGRQRAYHTTYEGVLPNIERRHAETDSDAAAREARAVHARDPVPDVQRLPPPRREPGRHGRRAQHLAADREGHPRHARVHRRHGALRARAHDRGAPAEGDPRAAGVPDGRRARLPEPGTRGGDARRRRGAADPPGHADRQRPRRRALHPGRALDRAPPARQPAADRHAAAAPRPGQHVDRRRARRGHHHGGRPHRGHRAARGRARRRDRVLGRPEGAPRGGALASPARTCPGGGRSRRRRSVASAARASFGWRASASTTCAT